MYSVHWAHTAGNILALDAFPSDQKWDGCHSSTPVGTTCGEFAALDPSSAKGRRRKVLWVAHADPRIGPELLGHVHKGTNSPWFNL